MGPGGPGRNWLDLRWHPGAWALTADDFPAGEATALEVQEAWLTDPVEDDPSRHPVITRLPGLQHLPWPDGDPDRGLMLSGVQVGEVEVFTTILVRDQDELAAEALERSLGYRLGEHETDDVTGERHQVAVAAAPRGDHLVAIGHAAPTTADVDWEAELDRAVALVDAKLKADPDGNGATCSDQLTGAGSRFRRGPCSRRSAANPPTATL